MLNMSPEVGRACIGQGVRQPGRYRIFGMATGETTSRMDPAQTGLPESAADSGMAGSGGRRQLQRISSAALLQGARRIIIEHAGSDYLLQLTGKGKLILTK